MKKHIILSLSAMAGIAIAITCQSATSCTPAPAGDRDYSTIYTPDIPTSVELCGQTVDLDRSDMWERYDRELTSMIYTHGNTLLTIKRANKYFPVMAPILKQNGIPLDVLYLACIESNLNPRALSPAKAAGIWQFMPGTAKQYGLEVNDEIDERYNLEKATAAACRYLKSALGRYGNWESVMASYNAGMGKISGELEKQLASSSFDLYLVDETSRYVFRIMAMKEVMEHPQDYGFVIEAHQLYQPIDCEIVEVKGAVADWPEWAADHGITYAQLREENPWIRAKSLTNRAGKTYKVRVPKKNALSRKTQAQSVYNKNWIAR